MKQEDMNRRQKIILKNIFEDLKQLEDVVEFVKADEEREFDQIVVEHEDVGIGNDTVLGQYYFLPDSLEENEVEQFMISMTISDELDEKKQVDMLQAIALVNYMIPTGAFVLDPSLQILSYKRGVTLRVGMDETENASIISYEMMAALHIVSMFVAPLVAYMYDEVTWEEFIQACEIVIAR